MRQTLNLYVYLTGGNISITQLTNYGPLVEDLSFSTHAPGGYGDLTCTLRVPRSRIIPPEVRIFANVALMDGFFSVFQGRLDEPTTSMDATNGDLIKFTCQGAATIFKDEPLDSAYTGKTAQYIANDQLVTLRGAYLPIDADQSAVLPNAPVATFNPAFNGKDIEEVITELNDELGDYTWAVWGHPRNKDLYGFPTWQFNWHQRNFLTNPVVNYIASLASQLTHDIRPTIEYSYSAIQILYRDATSTTPQQVTVKDKRLNGNKSQGTATLPYRLLRKDLSDALLTSTEALAIANALLAQYQNGGYKVTLDIANVTDANGVPIPLHQVRADSIISIPNLAPLGATLPTTYVPNVTIFYVVETQYEQRTGQTPKLTLTCDSFYDTSAYQLARMQRHHEKTAKSRRVHGAIQATGESELGQVGTSWPSTALNTDTFEAGVNFKTSMVYTPSSITLTVASSNNVSNPPSVTDITTSGFEFTALPHANGAGFWRGSYLTQGN